MSALLCLTLSARAISCFFSLSLSLLLQTWEHLCASSKEVSPDAWEGQAIRYHAQQQHTPQFRVSGTPTRKQAARLRAHEVAANKKACNTSRRTEQKKGGCSYQTAGRVLLGAVVCGHVDVFDFAISRKGVLQVAKIRAVADVANEQTDALAVLALAPTAIPATATTTRRRA